MQLHAVCSRTLHTKSLSQQLAQEMETLQRVWHHQSFSSGILLRQCFNMLLNICDCLHCMSCAAGLGSHINVMLNCSISFLWPSSYKPSQILFKSYNTCNALHSFMRICEPAFLLDPACWTSCAMRSCSWEIKHSARWRDMSVMQIAAGLQSQSSETVCRHSGAASAEPPQQQQQSWSSFRHAG